MFVSKIKCVFAVQECKWLCLYVLGACEGKFKAQKTFTSWNFSPPIVRLACKEYVLIRNIRCNEGIFV